MIGLALKWLTVALFALAFFSAATALYMYYTMNFGACSESGHHNLHDRCWRS